MDLQRDSHAEAPSEAPGPLHVCPDCDSDLVYPLDWAEAGPERWTVELRCPNCETVRSGTFGQDLIDALDIELDSGVDALLRDLTDLSRANMVDDVERFTGAVLAGAILPEDF